MRKYYNRQLNCNLVEIFSGDFYVSNDPNEAISTLLGSCVALCLFDKSAKIAGMNHFLVPGDARFIKSEQPGSSKDGLYAIEYLTQQMKNQGANFKHVTAGVFGGGHMLSRSKIFSPDDNVRLAKTYLKMLKIPIVKEDTGGNVGRQVIFFCKNGDMAVRHVNQTMDALKLTKK